jgi:prefoldin subunit 5
MTKEETKNAIREFAEQIKYHEEEISNLERTIESLTNDLIKLENEE